MYRCVLDCEPIETYLTNLHLFKKSLNNFHSSTTALDLLDEAGAIAQLEFHEAGLDEDEGDAIPTVDEHTVASVISEWSGIPMGKLETKEMDRLNVLEDELGRRVKGQGRAVRGVARAIRRARAGLRDPNRPVASFLFSGPTGTGMCRCLFVGSLTDALVS